MTDARRDFHPNEVSTIYRALMPELLQNGPQWRAACPIHQGEGDSFAVAPDTGLWACHSGQCGPKDGGGDVYHLVMALDGVRFPEAKRRVDELLGGAMPDLTPKPEKEDRWAGWKPVSVPVSELPSCDFKAYRYGMPEPGRVPWLYTEGGRFLRADVRYVDAETGEKTVLPWTIWEGPGGARKWRNKDLPAPRPLYNLDALVDGRGVLVVEGAKTADAAAAMFPDLAVVTWPGGSGGAKHADWSPLAGYRVAVWRDADEAGMKAAREVVQGAGKAGALQVAIVAIPDTLPEGWDLADPMPEGLDARRLVADALDIEATPKVEHTPAGNWEKRAPENFAAQEVAPFLRPGYRYHHRFDRWMAYDAATGTWRETVRSLAWAAVADAIDTLGLAPTGYGERYVSSVLGLLKRDLGVQDFSKRTGFANGLLVDGELVPHGPEHLLLNSLPFPYDPTATCEPVIEWLRFVMKGNAELVHILRCCLHAVVNGRADFQVFFELLGPGGSGKGTFMRLASALVGEHATCATDLHQLEQNRFEAASLRDKLLIQINDADKYGGAVSMLKRVTGFDEIRAEEKGKQQGATFRPAGIVIITVNEPIRSSDYTSGLARRRITIRFDNQIDMAQARDLEAEFRPYLSGLYNWVNKLDPRQVAEDLRSANERVEALAATRAEVEIETNPLAAWAAERLFYLPSAKSKVGAANRIPGRAGETAAFYECSAVWLFASYREWCDGACAQPVSMKRFSANLMDLLTNQYKLKGIQHKANEGGGKGAHIYGVTLSNDLGGITIEEARRSVRDQANKVRDIFAPLTPKDPRWKPCCEGCEVCEGLSRLSPHMRMQARTHACACEACMQGGAKTTPHTSHPSQGFQNAASGEPFGDVRDYKGTIEEGDA